MEPGETTPENTTPVDETGFSDEQLENVHGGSDTWDCPEWNDFPKKY